VAIVVSKKIAKSAVVRNRIRRRIYESIRKQNLLEGKLVDVVVVVHDENLAKIDAQMLDMRLSSATENIYD
jgi:ribonuclease P protein component